MKTPTSNTNEKTTSPNAQAASRSSRQESNVEGLPAYSLSPPSIQFSGAEAPPPSPFNPSTPESGHSNVQTPLPFSLQSGIEHLSGLSMGDVNVHYNSSKPAQFKAYAYAQGTDIHIGPGQERHLPHEAWHVVQQKQGRVQPTLQMKGADVNDNPELESEADTMGQRAAALGREVAPFQPAPLQRAKGATVAPFQPAAPISRKVIQRAFGFEFETPYVIKKDTKAGLVNLKKLDVLKDYGDGLKLEADVRSDGDSVIEMVLDPPVQENEPKKLQSVLKKFGKVGGEMHENRKAPFKFSTGGDKYLITPSLMGFIGNPQITGGVRFDKLFEFFEAANDPAQKRKDGDPHASAIGQLTGKVGGGRDDVSIAGAKSIEGSPELKGLVAFLAMYVQHGDAGPMMNYTKLISSSFMNRTDFATMFAGTRESRSFSLDPAKFVKLVLDAAGLPDTENERVFKRGIRKSYDKNSPDYNTNVVDQTPGLDMTRGQWLTQLTNGRDMLTAKLHDNKDLAFQLDTLGALGTKMDRVGDQVGKKKDKNLPDPTGIILELRNMRDQMDYDKFIGVANEIFSYLVALNNSEREAE